MGTVKLEYDEFDPVSIEEYARKLVGKTFLEVCEEDIGKQSIIKEEGNYKADHENKKRKGGLGELIEERYFHYHSNNDARPDFDKAGVELKVTPYKKNKNGSISAKERLVLTMIDYYSVINEDFFESHMWQKARLILLIYYLYDKEIKDRLNYEIGYVKLFSPPESDMKIIQHDFEVITQKIREGKAHELSEADTLYLGAAPKASSSKDRRKQPCSDELAKPRAFAFKNSYMTYVLNHYIIPDKNTYEPIIKKNIDETFEEYIINTINQYRNYTVDELCDLFYSDNEKIPKSLGALLVYRMLEIKGNQAEEFVKANIVIKTIRLKQNNKIKENMSFPTFKFKELVEEEWEDSAFGNYLRETRFLFVVYKYDVNEKLRLKGCQFWNIPYADLEGNVKTVWEQTKKVIQNGLKIEVKKGKLSSNLPSKSENPVCHVRPHGKNSEDRYELPDGRTYPKQCFWLNNTYIASQLEKHFFEE